MKFVKVIRPLNLILIAVTQALVLVFLLNRVQWAVSHYLTIVLTVLIAAGGNIINDYADWNSDGFNLKRKWSGYKKHLLLYYGAITLLVIPLALLLKPSIQIISFINLILLFAYSFYFKRVPLLGNMVISWLISSSILILGILENAFTPALFAMASFAFIITLVREVVKDAEDLDGDVASNIKTLPYYLSQRALHPLLITILVVGAVLPFIFFVVSIKNELLITGTVNLLFNSYIAIQINNARVKEDYHCISTTCKWSILVGVCTLVFY